MTYKVSIQSLNGLDNFSCEVEAKTMEEAIKLATSELEELND